MKVIQKVLLLHDLGVNLLLSQAIGRRIASLNTGLLQLVLLLLPQRHEVHDGVRDGAVRAAFFRCFALLTLSSFLATFLAFAHASLCLCLLYLIR